MKIEAMPLLLILIAGALPGLGQANGQVGEITNISFDEIPTEATFQGGRTITMNGDVDVNGDLSTDGVVTSLNGGFQFPDGTLQSTAAQTCNFSWQLIYEHDENGVPLAGSMAALIDSINQGFRRTSTPYPDSAEGASQK